MCFCCFGMAYVITNSAHTTNSCYSSMALKLPLIRVCFPISLDPNPTLAHPLPSSELRFSRYDSPNALDRRRSPNRRVFRRTNKPDADEPSSSLPNGVDPHPAFRFSNIPKSRPKPLRTPPENIKIGDDGISYVIEGAPFEFKYSYTETPKAKPLKIREPPYVPFGPSTMPRPWTGRAPLPPSKKKLKEFDSFVLPPPHKKGIKPVQSPGPFLPGTSPRYVHSREEILGEPLTQEEITDLVRSSIKTNRQMNIGRDGLTHNMLDNIHAHWKRRRVCKIKCKGVCTVDMDNVCQQLEEKTGGKVIHRNGGMLYLFRGRNYNYKTRPRFPLMLWKPVPPVYPRLIRRVPEGLTLEQATEMRQKGKQLIPICKLAKNGFYCGLAKDVREAFEECELVRINCQGLNKSDYRKIGAKLRDLVPCTLLSFEEEHILMWRGPNWKSSLPNPGDESKGANNENGKTLSPEVSAPGVHENSAKHMSNLSHDASIFSRSSGLTLEKADVPRNIKQFTTMVTNTASHTTTYEVETINNVTGSYGEPEHCVSNSPRVDIHDHDTHAKCPSEVMSDSHGTEDMLDCESCSDDLSASSSGYEVMLAASDNHTNVKIDPNVDYLLDDLEAKDVTQPSMLDAPRMKGVLSLLEQAVEKGSALVLDEDSWDADKIFQASVALAKSAPPGPVFMKQKKAVVQKSDKQEGEKGSKPATVLDKKETATVSVFMKGKGKKTYKAPRNKEKYDERFLNVAPQGTLGVDELAKLLT